MRLHNIGSVLYDWMKTGSRSHILFSVGERESRELYDKNTNYCSEIWIPSTRKTGPNIKDIIFFKTHIWNENFFTFWNPYYRYEKSARNQSNQVLLGANLLQEIEQFSALDILIEWGGFIYKKRIPFTLKNQSWYDDCHNL